MFQGVWHKTWLEVKVGTPGILAGLSGEKPKTLGLKERFYVWQETEV